MLAKIRNENVVLNTACKTTLGLLKQANNIKGNIPRKQLAHWAKTDSSP